MRPPSTVFVEQTFWSPSLSLPSVLAPPLLARCRQPGFLDDVVQPGFRGGIEPVLVICVPGDPQALARRNLAEAVEPHRDRLTVELAQHDAVGAEMLDGLDADDVITARYD